MDPRQVAPSKLAEAKPQPRSNADVSSGSNASSDLLPPPLPPDSSDSFTRSACSTENKDRDRAVKAHIQSVYNRQQQRRKLLANNDTLIAKQQALKDTFDDLSALRTSINDSFARSRPHREAGGGTMYTEKDHDSNLELVGMLQAMTQTAANVINSTQPSASDLADASDNLAKISEQISWMHSMQTAIPGHRPPGFTGFTRTIYVDCSSPNPTPATARRHRDKCDCTLL